MIKMDKRELSAVDRLLNSEDFETFMEWIKKSRIEEALQSTEIDKEPKRSWTQGKVQQLGWIMTMVRSARKDLEAVERNRGE